MVLLRTLLSVATGGGTLFGRLGMLIVALSALAFAAAALIQPANAQSVQRIAAIVNDQVISAYDLEQRVRLVITTSGMQATPEVIERVREQVLSRLIEEELKLQEARKNEVPVGIEEIDQSIARLAQRNQMQPAQIFDMLRGNGVDPATLRRQIEADIVWNRLVEGRFASRVGVTEEDVDQALEQLEASAGKPQYWVLEIFLGVSSPEQDEQVQRTAMGLVEQLRTGQAGFQDMAAQFSESMSASNGGDVGWVSEDQLSPAVAAAVQQMRPGTLSMPIRGVGGYYILALRDRRVGTGTDPRKILLRLQQVVVPVPPDAPREELLRAGQLAVAMVQRNPSCTDIPPLLRANPFLLAADLGERRVTELTEPFQRAVAGLTRGEMTQPVRSEAGFHVLFVCDRRTDGSDLPSRDAIEDRLFDQQLSMVARRYLRDLRRDATIEMR